MLFLLMVYVLILYSDFFCNVCFLRKEIKCILILKEKSRPYLMCSACCWWRPDQPTLFMYSSIHSLVSFFFPPFFCVAQDRANIVITQPFPSGDGQSSFSIWALVPSRALATVGIDIWHFLPFSFISQNSLDVRIDRYPVEVCYFTATRFEIQNYICFEK